MSSEREPSASGFVHKEQLTPMEEEMRTLKNALSWLKARDQAVKDRTPYPKFCRSPHLCCNTGRCQSDPTCID